MKKGMCKGCDYLTKTEQIGFYAEDGITLLEPPTKELKPFCKRVQLHVNYIERIIEGDNPCLHYRIDA